MSTAKKDDDDLLTSLGCDLIAIHSALKLAMEHAEHGDGRNDHFRRTIERWVHSPWAQGYLFGLWTAARAKHQAIPTEEHAL